MKKITFIFIFLLSYVSIAQHTISGTFTPAKDYTWLIAYRLKPGTQVYAVDTAIKNGEFTLNFPENLPSGTYRLVYAVPQEEFYFDVIYNAKEDIVLNFDSDQGVSFINSKENILFNSYFKEVQDVERRLITHYSSGLSDTKEYQDILEKYNQVQKTYENNSEGFICHNFIKANKPYVPERYESIENYVKNRKASYFKHLNLSDLQLQASGYLTDKITNYIFTALPLDPLSKADTEKIMIANLDTVYAKLQSASEAYKFHILYTLWTQTSGGDFNTIADHIYTTYLKNSSEAAKNKQIITKIETYQRLRIGAIAPDITWKKDGSLEKLSTLEKAKNYVLVFWSSTCGHCLKELPALHKELKTYTDVKVIAVALENDDVSWKLESAKLEGFEHAIALGKWDSEYADLYDIHSTPTYFILDADKRIIEKPVSDKKVVEFLKK